MRRNVTKGQQAMALAMMYPEAEKGGRGKKATATNSAETAGFSVHRLNEARAVRRSLLMPSSAKERRSDDPAVFLGMAILRSDVPTVKCCLDQPEKTG